MGCERPPVFRTPKIGGGVHIDPRNTPGYRLHRALSNLSDIDVDELDPADRERIDAVMTLLEQVSLLTNQLPRKRPTSR